VKNQVKRISKTDAKLEVGIVGVGGISRMFHIPLLKSYPQIKLKYISDIYDASSVAKSFNVDFIKINDNLSILPDCDIVFLAIPVGVREPYIEEFSKRNRRITIVTEKPFAESIEKHQKYLSLNENMSCTYQKTSFSTIRQLRDIISNKLFGELIDVKISEGGIGRGTSKGRNHYQNDFNLCKGGIVMETGCHTLSQLDYIFSNDILEVKNSKLKYHGKFDIDAEVIFNLKNESINIDIHYNLSIIRPIDTISSYYFENAVVQFNHSNPKDFLKIRPGKFDSKSVTFGLDRDLKWATTTQSAFYLNWKNIIDKTHLKESFKSEKETSIRTTSLISSIYLKGRSK
jgi:predicted dehydrogenase